MVSIPITFSSVVVVQGIPTLQYKYYMYYSSISNRCTPGIAF